MPLAEFRRPPRPRRYESVARRSRGPRRSGRDRSRQVALDGHELPAVHRFPSALRPFRRKTLSGSSGSLGPGEFLSGACLLIRRLAWTATGPLDDSFFFYWEESDWQFRARKLGWQLALADVTVRHVGSGSSDGQPLMLRLLSFEGYERFILKHEGKAALLLHRVTNLPGVLWTALTLFIRRSRGDAESLRRDAAHARLTQLLRPVPPARTSMGGASRGSGERANRLSVRRLRATRDGTVSPFPGHEMSSMSAAGAARSAPTCGRFIPRFASSAWRQTRPPPRGPPPGSITSKSDCSRPYSLSNT